MAIEITLFVNVQSTPDRDVHIRLLDISGLSIEEAEGLADYIDRSILPSSKYEAAAVSRIAWKLLRDFSETSWVVITRYSDGRNDSHLFYSHSGVASTLSPKKPPPGVKRVSRYTRTPII